MHKNHNRWSHYFIRLGAVLCLWGGALPLRAQGTGGGTQSENPLIDLVLVTEKLVPKLQEVIESPLLAGLENLAFWVAVIVMMLSFARLFRENDGAGKELLVVLSSRHYLHALWRGAHDYQYGESDWLRHYQRD